MTEAEKAYQYFVIAVPENEEQAKAYFWARKALQPTITPPSEWVSVEDRMPEDDTPAGRKQITVMVATKAGKVTIASRVFEPERDYCGKVYPARWLWSRWLNNHVTHWMELPAPPDRRPPEGENNGE